MRRHGGDTMVRRKSSAAPDCSPLFPSDAYPITPPARRPPPGFVEPLEGRILFSAPPQWSSRGVGGGGAFFAPSFSPHTPAEMYVASDMSGLYRSTDTGASWSIRDFHEVQAN